VVRCGLNSVTNMIRFGRLTDDAPPYIPPQAIDSRRLGTVDAAKRLSGMMGLERRFEGVTVGARSITRLRALADIGAPPSYKRAPSGRASKG
jgi:hypothetical protein